jgi:hypothetical protein
VLGTRSFCLMWIAYALGCSAGLMVISQLIPFAHSVGMASVEFTTMTLVVGACGNAAGAFYPDGCLTGSAASMYCAQ